MTDTQPIRWWSHPRLLLRQILMLDDTPHSIALGTTVGMFFGMTPTVGIQMLLVVLFGFLMRPFLRFNHVAGVLTVYVSNPVTIVPIYWFDYKVGTWFLQETVTYERFLAILQYDGLAGWLQMLLSLLVDVGAPLFLGSLVVASVSAAITYPTMRFLFWMLRRQEPPGVQTQQQETVASGVD